jgi:hypothetical protein
MDGEVRPIEPKPLMVSGGDRRGQAPCSRRAARRRHDPRPCYRSSWFDFLGYPGYLASGPV